MASNSFFQTYWLLLEDQIEPSFFIQGELFHGTAIHSFMGYMEQIIFNSSYLLRIAAFWEELSSAFNFLRVVYLFHQSNCSPFFLWSIVSVFVTETIAVE